MARRTRLALRGPLALSRRMYRRRRWCPYVRPVATRIRSVSVGALDEALDRVSRPKEFHLRRRFGQKFYERVIARLLPLESLAGGSGLTRGWDQRRHVGALAGLRSSPTPSGSSAAPQCLSASDLDGNPPRAAEAWFPISPQIRADLMHDRFPVNNIQGSMPPVVDRHCALYPCGSRLPANRRVIQHRRMSVPHRVRCR
jgi:hypothetical protein